MCCVAEKTITEPAVLSLAEARVMVEQLAKSEAWQKMDDIDRQIEATPGAFFELPTDNLFTPFLYTRTVLMKAGQFISTRIHLVDHPFFIHAGRILCWTDDQGVVEMSAPYVGVTKPGTRRFIYILEDCLFSTVHHNPDNETDPDKIVARSTYNNRELREKIKDLP